MARAQGRGRRDLPGHVLTARDQKGRGLPSWLPAGGHVGVAIACTGAREIVEAVELARAHGPLRWYSEGLPVKRAGALLTPFVHHGARRWAVQHSW